jgi:hypothetical protein
MKKLLIALLLTVSAFAQPNPRLTSSGRTRPMLESAVGIGNDIITHVADGGGWKTSITLINLSQSKPAVYTLRFYGDSGAARSFSFEGIGSASILTGTLSAGGSTVIITTGNASPVTGWAQFDYFGTTDSLAGFAVFINDNGNEAAVPFESSIGENPVLSFDNTNGYSMGVALANSNFLTVTCTATFKDGNGSILGINQFTMAPMTHTSFMFADQWRFTADHQGAVSFDCSDQYGLNAFGVAVLALRFTPKGVFTSVAAFEKWTLD